MRSAKIFVRRPESDLLAFAIPADTRHFVTYDDPQSLAAKATFVRERGLGGMMYWEHRHDIDDELLDALRDGLDAPAAAAAARAETTR